MFTSVLTKSIAPSERRGWHAHRAAALTFVASGSMTEEIPDGAVHCARFSLQFKPARMRHTTTIGIAGGDLLVVNLASETELPAEASVLEGGVAQALGIGLERAEDEIEAAVGRVFRWWPPTSCADVPDWLLEARTLLTGDDRSAFERRPLAGLADRIGRHPVYVARAFRRAFGLSVAAYQRRLRLDQAATRVLATDQSLADLAVDCGYTDQSHMANDFRRIIGQSASQLRASATRYGAR